MTADYLELSLSAERWIGTLQRPTDHGIAWSHSTERPEVVSHTLYNGSAGVLLFYLELHAATGQQRFLDVALAAADDLVAYAGATQWQSCAMYTGWPGLAFALGEAARLSGRATLRRLQPRDVWTVCGRAHTASVPASDGSNRCRSPTSTASRATAKSTMRRSARRAPVSCCCMPLAPVCIRRAAVGHRSGRQVARSRAAHRCRAELGIDVGHAVSVESGEFRPWRRRRRRVHGDAVSKPLVTNGFSMPRKMRRRT